MNLPRLPEDALIIKSVYESEGSEITPGALAFPLDQEDFEKWCNRAQCLYPEFLIELQIRRDANGKVLGLTGSVNSKGAFLAST